MNTDSLNKWLTLAANFGVLIGLFFLAYELKQDRELTRTQISLDISRNNVDWSIVETEAEIAGLLMKSRNGEFLSEVEEFRLRNHHMAYFRFLEGIHYQYRYGMFPESEFGQQLVAWRVRFSWPSVNELWCERRGAFSIEFAQEVDNLVSGKCD